MKKVESGSIGAEEYFSAAYYKALAEKMERDEKTWLGRRVMYSYQDATVVGLVCLGIGEPIVPIVLIDGEKDPKVLPMWSANGYFASSLLDEPKVALE